MINVDTVYQKVLVITNKEQRGYITPQEFNLLADKAQNEIFESYFHDMKTAYHKPKNYTGFSDDLEILSETGIIGITIFTILNFYVLISLIRDYFKKKFLNEITLLLFCNFFILFWPLQTTGSFFSTWNGIFYWIFFSFFFHFKNKLTSEST